ncbi:MAG: sigma-70 family RNA polymerase sigma factor, partial [Oscillospiraceae bacterium]|nr:sigma-70 family RNA polymerase sigma factor [Oscillospiraceae bacterium]
MLSQAEQEALIRSHYRSIYNYCLYRLRNADAALDLTQETFTLMIEKAAGLTNDYMRQWLNRVAENKCSAWLRKHKRERAQLRLDELNPDALDRLLNEIGDCSLGVYYEKYEAVMLERLSPKESLLCELRFARGLT